MPFQLVRWQRQTPTQRQRCPRQRSNQTEEEGQTNRDQTKRVLTDKVRVPEARCCLIKDAMQALTGQTTIIMASSLLPVKRLIIWAKAMSIIQQYIAQETQGYVITNFRYCPGLGLEQFWKPLVQKYACLQLTLPWAIGLACCLLAFVLILPQIIPWYTQTLIVVNLIVVNFFIFFCHKS